MTLSINMSTEPPFDEGFVYLDTIDSTIRQYSRYASSENFVGAPIDGYQCPRIVMTKEVARALQEAQKRFNALGYDIVVYDAYRPQRAINHFIRWSEDPQDQSMKDIYYPRIAKENAFDLGFIARRSAHSRGSAVDLSIIRCDFPLYSPAPHKRILQDGLEIIYLDDGTLDMGSSFDLFDEASSTQTALITPEQQQNRYFLKEIMENCGFENYRKEWWHFSLKNEPFPTTYFDFPIH